MSVLTPSQTVGPFFALVTSSESRTTLVAEEHAGERILLEGTLLDGDGHPVPDGLLEIWQADATGGYNHPDDPCRGEPMAAFTGFGRVHTDSSGTFGFETIKPGSVPDAHGQTQAPHVLVSVFARGLLSRLVTRVYFEDEPTNVRDPVLACVSPERRSTLIAARRSRGHYRIDLTLQGPGETVFFDV